MEYLNKFISFISNSPVVISFLTNISLAICWLYNYFSKKKYIKGVLGFNKNKVQFTHSEFVLNSDLRHKHRFITYESLESISNVIKLLNIVNKQFDLIEKDITNNEINIGGFLTNKKVNVYFNEHFKNFKIIENISRQKVLNNRPINHDVIEYTSSDESGFKIGDDYYLKMDKYSDYAFLIKLIETDFRNADKKTVHILFGGGNIGTIKATEYLLTHYRQIYKKYKKGHYFFAIKINLTDNSIDFSKGIIDLTDKMF